ncbi:hypothetical protein [Parabacteroides sp. Marseille-P3160]|uniref:hypothetical protein n=1 Tax=Parabacteroides sp. Marseille-P3160 TaxID=1917887 RepID=UPI0009BA2139|nr:hypothetical protein [Parabacteroides sp. Marseille-P3160]
MKKIIFNDSILITKTITAMKITFSMLKMISFFILLLILTGIGCEEKETGLTSGKVIFYTNAQAMVNCGPFNVTVYVDNNDVGFISNPYVADNLPDAINTTSTIVLEKTKGKYSYTAKMDCGQSGTWTGEFEIRNNNVYIFLDIKDCILK